MRPIGFIFLMLGLLSGSCIVSKKKYDDILAQKLRTDGELADRTTQLTKASEDLSDLGAKLEKLRRDTTGLQERALVIGKK